MQALRFRPVLRALLTLSAAATAPAQVPPAPAPPPTAPVVLHLATSDGALRAGTLALARHQGEGLPMRPVPPAEGGTPRPFAARDFVAGALTLRDLPAGRLVFLITAADHALTCSPPCLVGPTPAELTVRLQTGACVSGRVVGEDGKPVAGAKVTTDEPGGNLTDEQFALLTSLSVSRVTRTQATTDAEGRFELPHLALGTYVLRAGHANWCQGQLPELQLGKHDERRDLGTLSLRRGAHVTGRLADAAARYDLRLQRIAGAAREPVAGGASRSLADGTFRFAARVPPGRYELYGLPWREDQPFGGGSDFGAFTVEVVVAAGQDEVVVPALRTKR